MSTKVAVFRQLEKIFGLIVSWTKAELRAVSHRSAQSAFPVGLVVNVLFLALVVECLIRPVVLCHSERKGSSHSCCIQFAMTFGTRSHIHFRSNYSNDKFVSCLPNTYKVVIIFPSASFRVYSVLTSKTTFAVDYESCGVQGD